MNVLGVTCRPHTGTVGADTWRGRDARRSVHVVHYDRSPNPWLVSVTTWRGGVPAAFRGRGRSLEDAAERAEFLRVCSEGE